MRRRLVILLLLAAGIAGKAADRAVTAVVSSGGGGKSVGTRFTVTGSIGQADATVTRLTGSRFGIDAGIQAMIVALQTPGAPTLEVTASGNQIIISWDNSVTGWTLQQTASIGPNASWQNSSGVVSNRLSLTAPSSNRFYRLTK